MITLLVKLHEQQEQQVSISQQVKASHQPAQRHIYAADKCLQCLRSHSMPDLERMICGGLMAYTVSSQPRSASSLRTHVYDDHLQAFLTELAQYTYSNYDQEVLLWVTFCFAAVQEHIFPEAASHDREDSRRDSKDENGGGGGGTAEYFFHHAIMRFKQSNRWERVDEVLKKFLWTEERVREWRERYQECVDRYRPQHGTSRGSTPSLGMGGSSKTYG